MSQPFAQTATVVRRPDDGIPGRQSRKRVPQDRPAMRRGPRRDRLISITPLASILGTVRPASTNDGETTRERRRNTIPASVWLVLPATECSLGLRGPVLESRTVRRPLRGESVPQVPGPPLPGVRGEGGPGGDGPVFEWRPAKGVPVLSLPPRQSASSSGCPVGAWSPLPESSAVGARSRCQ